MRKSGWAVAAGFGSMALLLTACGGSASTSNTASGTAASQAQASSGSSGAASHSASASASASKKGGSGSSATPTPHHTAGPQPSSGTVSFPPQGTTVMVIQKTSVGYVLAEADGQVVYTYAKDKKNGAPTCTGSCADAWAPATGTPQAGPADTFPGTFGVVKGAGGVEQITYNGYPLYTYKDAKPMTASGNGLDGEWHVVPMSESDISGA
jgi:predicted lipoprotein with Yx(FWY)xxD motif